MLMPNDQTNIDSVALLAEGVDRNHAIALKVLFEMCRPPRGGRG